MNHTFEFTSTQNDLLDAFDADRTERTGMRRFARMAGAGLGLMWLVGFVVVMLSDKQSTKRWLPFLWLILGLHFTWKYLLSPAVARYRIRSSNAPEQRVRVSFLDDEIRIWADSVGEWDRTWDELSGFLPAQRGVLIAFTDGVVNWLPSRVFATESAKNALVSSLVAKLEERTNDGA